MNRTLLKKGFFLINAPINRENSEKTSRKKNFYYSGNNNKLRQLKTITSKKQIPNANNKLQNSLE